MEKVAFLCLGRMGYPMAGHLARAGHAVCVYNRSGERAARFVAEHGGRAVASAAAATKDADVVLSCTGNDDDLQDILLGAQGGLAAMKPGSLLIDHTTA